MEIRPYGRLSIESILQNQTVGLLKCNMIYRTINTNQGLSMLIRFKDPSYMICNFWSLLFVSADDGYIDETALPSSFVDNGAVACPKLLI